MAFTNTRIKGLRTPKKRVIHWEDGSTGMGVRVSPAGRKTFIFMYRYEGTPRMMSIGTYPQVSLADARMKVAEARKKLETGLDPAKEWVETKRMEREAETVKDLVEEYLEKWARPHKRSAKEDERILRKDVLPAWGRKKAKIITKRDVITLLDSVVGRGSPIQANRTLAVIRKMFNFAVSRDIVASTPCTAITAPSPENRRDRVLTEDEIRTFWFGLDEAKMSEGSRLALKLQLLTGQRKGEIIAAEWEEFDLKANIWIIPAEKSKNGFSHSVPLSPQAIDILKVVREESGDSRWLFPTPRNKDIHLRATSVDHAVRNNLDKFEIEPFTPHDLRRTAATRITEMGISRLVVSKLLNHVESGVTAVYDRHSYDKEKRQALETWGRKVNEIITGKKGKVIALKRK